MQGAYTHYTNTLSRPIDYVSQPPQVPQFAATLFISRLLSLRMFVLISKPSEQSVRWRRLPSGLLSGRNLLLEELLPLVCAEGGGDLGLYESIPDCVREREEGQLGSRKELGRVSDAPAVGVT